MKFGYVLIFLSIFSVSQSLAQNNTTNYYWIGFLNKIGTAYSTDHPEEFLSARAIQRRINQGIQVDETDLPVSQPYLDSLTSRGAIIIHHSKWLNGVTIKATEPQFENILSSFNFIEETELTKPGIILKSIHDKFKDERVLVDIDTSYYGNSVFQVGQLNGQFLHNQGYLGQGMHIAVLDAGFLKVDELSAFEQIRTDNRILSTRDFVNPSSNIYLEDNHGMNVLSTMAGELPGFLIGTAPKAFYNLFRTEDAGSEYLIEEDNWVVAAEYADSLGVDIINSSLGYSEFDDPTMDHSYEQMDGKTTRVTRAANMAVQKGMLVFSSAGNEANDSWRYLVAPSDGDLVVGVGAVNKDHIWAPFSSLGPSSDGDIKPNVAALGWQSIVQKSDGEIGISNGTSFSSPILAGMAACLWQAFPNATNLQLKEAIERSASQYQSPDPLLGYGIPDFEKAFFILENIINDEAIHKYWLPGPNPFSGQLHFYVQDDSMSGEVSVSFFQNNGSMVRQEIFEEGQSIYFGNLSNLPDGFYIVLIESSDLSEFHKVIKISKK